MATEPLSQERLAEIRQRAEQVLFANKGNVTARNTIDLLAHIDALQAQLGSQTCVVCGEPASKHWNGLAVNPCLWGGPRLNQRDIEGWNETNEYTMARCRERNEYKAQLDAMTALARELAEALNWIAYHRTFVKEHMGAPLAKAREEGLLPNA